MQIYLVTYLLIGTEASMPQSMLPDAAHGSDAARWQITVAVCCRRVSVRRDHVHAATQHRLLRDPGVPIGHVVQVCWSRDPGVLYVVPGLLSRLSSSRRDVSRPRLKSLENRNPASRAQVCWSRDTGVRAEHSDGDYVVAVVLDQHRERPGAHQPRPPHRRHHHLPVHRRQRHTAAGTTNHVARDGSKGQGKRARPLH